MQPLRHNQDLNTATLMHLKRWKLSAPDMLFHWFERFGRFGMGDRNVRMQIHKTLVLQILSSGVYSLGRRVISLTETFLIYEGFRVFSRLGHHTTSLSFRLLWAWNIQVRLDSAWLGNKGIQEFYSIQNYIYTTKTKPRVPFESGQTMPRSSWHDVPNL